jgi:hypothetical protein
MIEQLPMNPSDELVHSTIRSLVQTVNGITELPPPEREREQPGMALAIFVASLTEEQREEYKVAWTKVEQLRGAAQRATQKLVSEEDLYNFMLMVAKMREDHG